LLELTFKTVIFGDSGVGKSSLTHRYLTGMFNEEIMSTIGVNIEVKYIIRGELKIALQIWDFGGEDRFRFILPGYVRGAKAGIFMYDITRAETLSNLKDWLEVFKMPYKSEKKSPIFLMVGGKLDLENKRKVSFKEGFNLAKEHSFSGFIECSAKTGINVETIFELLVDLLLEDVGLK